MMAVSQPVSCGVVREMVNSTPTFLPLFLRTRLFAMSNLNPFATPYMVLLSGVGPSNLPQANGRISASVSDSMTPGSPTVNSNSSSMARVSLTLGALSLGTVEQAG